MGLAATSVAQTWFHMDSNGCNAFIDVKCSFKAWLIIYNKSGRFKLIDAFKNDEAEHHLHAVSLWPFLLYFNVTGYTKHYQKKFTKMNHSPAAALLRLMSTFFNRLV